MISWNVGEAVDILSKAVTPGAQKHQMMMGLVEKTTREAIQNLVAANQARLERKSNKRKGVNSCSPLEKVIKNEMFLLMFLWCHQTLHTGC